MDDEKAITAYKRLRAKNWAVLAALLAWSVLVYIVAIVRMSGGGAP
jgi:hypothetical protein